MDVRQPCDRSNLGVNSCSKKQLSIKKIYNLRRFISILSLLKKKKKAKGVECILNAH